MNQTNSTLFHLVKADFTKGLVVAIITPAILGLASALQTPGFDLATFDWAMMVKIGIAAGLGYIVKNWLSTSDGKVFGRIG